MHAYMYSAYVIYIADVGQTSITSIESSVSRNFLKGICIEKFSERKSDGFELYVCF